MALFRKKPARQPSEQPPSGRGWIEGVASDAEVNEGTFVAFSDELRFYPHVGEACTIPWKAVAWVRVERLSTRPPDIVDAHPWVFALPSDANLVTGWLRSSDEPFVIASTSEHPAPLWLATMSRAGVVEIE